MTQHSSTESRLRLCDALHAGRYRILSVQTERGQRDELARRGIDQGQVLEVIYNNRQGTVLVETISMAMILGRACSFRIQLLPLPKPAEAVTENPALPEPIPLRRQAES